MGRVVVVVADNAGIESAVQRGETRYEGQLLALCAAAEESATVAQYVKNRIRDATGLDEIGEAADCTHGETFGRDQDVELRTGDNCLQGQLEGTVVIGFAQSD